MKMGQWLKNSIKLENILLVLKHFAKVDNLYIMATIMWLIYIKETLASNGISFKVLVQSIS